MALQLSGRDSDRGESSSKLGCSDCDRLARAARLGAAKAARRSLLCDNVAMPIDVVVLDQIQPSVAARIVALQRAAYRIEGQLINFDGIPPLHETENEVSALKITILGALDGTDLAGMIGYRRVGDVVEIDRLAVNPRVFLSGIATFLIMDVRRREQDATRFEVSTAAGNYPAIALYTKHGFRRRRDTVLASGPVIANFADP